MILLARNAGRHSLAPGSPFGTNTVSGLALVILLIIRRSQHEPSGDYE